jgi:putative PIN family toxin of toxin-antitoxin system
VNIVLDTNVLVSALLNPYGPPARILDLILLGKLTPLYDDRILHEYRQVLLQERFGFEVQAVEALLQYVELVGMKVVASPLAKRTTAPDPDDLMFLEVALAGQAETLITGNMRHFPATIRQGIRVVEPSAFLARWASST